LEAKIEAYTISYRVLCFLIKLALGVRRKTKFGVLNSAIIRYLKAIVSPLISTAFVSEPSATVCSFCVGIKSDKNSKDFEKSKGGEGFNLPPKEKGFKISTN
jgi:hypothetical protein